MMMTSPMNTFRRQSQQAELASLPSPHISYPAARHPLSRPLSSDLPTQDALYLFSNFSSYMLSPEEGAEGINSSEDFRDTVRLLDYARSIASVPQANVQVLHLKYRFHGPTQTFPLPFSSDRRLPDDYRDSSSRTRDPVPQPFSVLHDPVIKVDYMDNGVFEPLPAQAVISHISKFCQPPPRIIVISYVESWAIQNHLPALSGWGLTSSPPTYVFSPQETRIREDRPLQDALHHAIPMSMYAWPAEADRTHATGIGSGATSPSGSRMIGNTSSPMMRTRPTLTEDLSKGPTWLATRWAQRRRSSELQDASTMKRDDGEDISTGTGRTSRSVSPTTYLTTPSNYDRLPLWSLVPGINALHGSTASSLGLRISDFSAINLARNSSEPPKDPISSISSSPVISKASNIPVRLEAQMMTTSPAKVPTLVPQPRPTTSTTHLTPPEMRPAPNLMKRKDSLSPTTSGSGKNLLGWRSWRRVSMESALDEMGVWVGEHECTDVIKGIEGLNLGARDGEDESDGEDLREDCRHQAGKLLGGLLGAKLPRAHTPLDLG